MFCTSPASSLRLPLVFVWFFTSIADAEAIIHLPPLDPLDIDENDLITPAVGTCHQSEIKSERVETGTADVRPPPRPRNRNRTEQNCGLRETKAQPGNDAADLSKMFRGRLHIRRRNPRRKEGCRSHNSAAGRISRLTLFKRLRQVKHGERAKRGLDPCFRYISGQGLGHPGGQIPTRYYYG